MSHGVLKETTIENVIEIAAPVEKVFDFVVDVPNEPQWNPQMLQAEMLTPEPIGAGTRFRVRFGRGVGEALIEERPRSWAAISQSRALDVLGEGQIDETSDGSLPGYAHAAASSRHLAPAHPGLGGIYAPYFGSGSAQGEGSSRI
jgi:hypothetical protein